MKPQPNQEQLDAQELAGLLRKPEGEKGIKIAEMLNTTNMYITSFTYNCMEINDGDSVLEIGFGNGKLMPELLKRAKLDKLVGIELSGDMVKQGKKILNGYIQNKIIELHTASVEKMPFDDDSYNAICTINTLYFWPEALDCCKETLRVLKPGGKIYIGIRSKEEAQKLPSTQFGFALYEKDEAIALLENAGFINVHVKEQTDPPFEFNGETKIFQSWVVVGEKPKS